MGLVRIQTAGNVGLWNVCKSEIMVVPKREAIPGYVAPSRGNGLGSRV